MKNRQSVTKCVNVNTYIVISFSLIELIKAAVVHVGWAKPQILFVIEISLYG